MTFQSAEYTVLARIMTALDTAEPCRYNEVMAIIRDGELSAGDVLAVCVILGLSAGVLLGAPRDDLRSLDDLTGLHSQS